MKEGPPTGSDNSIPASEAAANAVAAIDPQCDTTFEVATDIGGDKATVDFDAETGSYGVSAGANCGYSEGSY